MQRVINVAFPALVLAAATPVGAELPIPSGDQRCVVGSINYARAAQFNSGSTELTKNAAQNLQLLAIQMRGSRTSIFVHAGVGEQLDPGLSKQRSAVVGDFLVSQGLDSERLVIGEAGISDLNPDGLRIQSEIERDCDSLTLPHS